MYGIRSSVVHGELPGESKVRKWVQILTGEVYDDSRDWELKVEAIDSARNIVRKAIRACSELSKLPTSGPHWPLPNNFDEQIMSAVQRKKWQKAADIRHDS